MGNNNTKKNNSQGDDRKKRQFYREGQRYTSQFSLASFVGNLSGRSLISIGSNQSSISASRPWSRVSRRRWQEARLKDPLSASRTTWPVPHIESIFLPEFKVSSDVSDRKFKVVENIAKGAFGHVYKVQKLTTIEFYALKVLSKSQIVSEGAVQQVKEEARIQEACGHHTFIVGAVLRWQTRKRLYIVTDYIAGGELLRLLESYGKLPEALTKIYVAELALALDFLHNAGVIYRDLKPENILVDDNGHLLITDFGLSKWLNIGGRTTTLCGTLHYMASLAANKLQAISEHSDKALIHSRVQCKTLADSYEAEMNARCTVFSMSMEGRQVDEAIASIFHTVLFHRSYGKFLYTDEGSYSMGTIGYMDVDCDFIDFTYVCCTSDVLDRTVKREISLFSELLRGGEGTAAGQISLEFFQKKRNRWPFPPECIPWEVWTLRLELINIQGEDERQVSRERVGEMLQDKVLYVTEVMNKHEYVPKVPTQSDVDLIFDTTFPDIQPYLFKVNYSLAGPQPASVGNTMKKLIRETLNLS